MGSFPCPDEPTVPYRRHISYSDALGLVQGNCQERNRPEKQGHGDTVGPVPVRGSDRICPVRHRRSRFPGRAMSFLGRNRYNCPFYRAYTETPSVATQIIEISTTYSTDNFRTKRSYRNRGTCYKCGFLLTVEKTAFFLYFPASGNGCCHRHRLHAVPRMRYFLRNGLCFSRAYGPPGENRRASFSRRDSERH